MKILLSSIALLLLLMISSLVSANVAVIIHPSNTSTLSSKDIKKIYLGKLKKFSNGNKAEPFNQKENSKDYFNKVILKKSGKQIKAYWSKRVFTGLGTPPTALKSDAEVIKMVAEMPNAIGYIQSSAKVDDSVKVVLEL